MADVRKSRSRQKTITGDGKPIYKREATPKPALPRSREKNITGTGKTITKRKK